MTLGHYIALVASLWAGTNLLMRLGHIFPYLLDLIQLILYATKVTSISKFLPVLEKLTCIIYEETNRPKGMLIFGQIIVIIDI